MLLAGEHLQHAVWERLRASATASPDAITLLILVALDVDALSTCAMLTRMLESEEISHCVKPVRDYSMMSEIFVTYMLDNAELRNVLLINCGGLVDLMGLLQERLDILDEGNAAGARSVHSVPHAECCWYVLDSHRPISLQNAMCDGDKLCVLHDEEPLEDLQELLEQGHILTDPEFEEEEEEEEEPPAQRRRLSEEQYRQMSPDSRAAQYHSLKQLERRYYSSSWHGTSSAVLAFSLVQSLGRSCNELLWLAAVGLTDQLVHERVVFETYVEASQNFQKLVRELNQDDARDTAEVTDEGVSVTISKHVSSSMKLEAVQELRLSLLRHWSLYEALEHSTYISSRLGLYNAKGRDNLDTWLARMGIPLQECRQNYVYMSKEIREALFERMHTYGGEFGLMHLTYPSFRQITSYNTTVGAADLVYCIDAQLEGVGVATAANASADAGDPDEGTQIAFGAAMATLTRYNARELSQRDGIERAKGLLRALMVTGNRIISQKQFANVGEFFKVILKQGADTDQFTHIQALTKLALYIADAVREGDTQKRGKPLLVAAPKKDKTHLVVAVSGSSRHWTGSGASTFGRAFLQVANDPEVHARVALESFESAVCIVASDDLEQFLEDVVLKYEPS
mmetsp:Transcript_47878/g.102295  ORF Transcript_47878/g.102295 Transcript_47878/m.102295 type:complete len:627 (-) Transcript_47878:26-1906(-)